MDTKQQVKRLLINTHTFDPQELELHNSAWKAAKIEILGSPTASIPDGYYSTILRRAEVIRRTMKTRK